MKSLMDISEAYCRFRRLDGNASGIPLPIEIADIDYLQLMGFDMKPL